MQYFWRRLLRRSGVNFSPQCWQWRRSCRPISCHLPTHPAPRYYTSHEENQRKPKQQRRTKPVNQPHQENPISCRPTTTSFRSAARYAPHPAHKNQITWIKTAPGSIGSGGAQAKSLYPFLTGARLCACGFAAAVQFSYPGASPVLPLPIFVSGARKPAGFVLRPAAGIRNLLPYVLLSHLVMPCCQAIHRTTPISLPTPIRNFSFFAETSANLPLLVQFRQESDHFYCFDLCDSTQPLFVPLSQHPQQISLIARAFGSVIVRLE